MKTKLKDLWNYAGDIKEALMNELIYYVPKGKASEDVNSSQHIESDNVILIFIQKKCFRIGKRILEKNNKASILSRNTIKKVTKAHFKYNHYSVT